MKIAAWRSYVVVVIAVRIKTYQAGLFALKFEIDSKCRYSPNITVMAS